MNQIPVWNFKKNIDRPDFWQFMTEIYGHGARGQGGHGQLVMVDMDMFHWWILV